MDNSNSKILVLGVGNILLKDEGVGVRVIERLQRDYKFPPNVEIIDGGTAGLGLLNLFEGIDHLIIVDAIQGNDTPGSLYRFKFEDISANIPKKFSPHQIGIFETLTVKKVLGKLPDTTIIAIQPKDCNHWGMELTPEIENKIPDVINLVMKELKSFGISSEFNSLTQ
ncbi:MAG: HyaD/HybD family hydrogenase maturation endopeptidase [Nitrospinae bacterium]|nr:HyaD/HybD family hydrogenase maturation endopeptidase [Nitrospinota bacterium]